MKYYLGVLIACILFIGCKKTIDSDNFNTCNNPANIIHGGVQIGLNENLSSDKSNHTLSFNCTTNNWQPCAGYVLKTCSNKSSNNFYISFDALITPGVCFSVVSKPWAPINLDMVSVGTYNLNFRINSHTYSGLLKISDTSYIVDVKGIKDADIIIYNDTLHKMPQHTIWGEISYFDEKDSVLAKKTIADLKLLGAVDSLYAPANYGYFQIDQQHKISFWNVDALNYPRDFIFKYYGDTLTLKNFVESYGTTGSDYFQVKIYTSEGQVYRNY